MLIVAMLMGCGPTQDQFFDRYVEATCHRNGQCGGQTEAECLDLFADAEWPESENYTPADGAACLDVVEQVDADADCSAEASIAISDACEGTI